MTRFVIALLLCLLSAPLQAQDKPSLYKSIDSRGEATWEAALKIWGWAEPGEHVTVSLCSSSGSFILPHMNMDIEITS